MYKVDASLRVAAAAAGRPAIAPVAKGARVLYKKAKDEWYLGTISSSGAVRVVVLLDNGEKVSLDAPVPRTKLRQVNLNRQRKTALTDVAAQALLKSSGEVVRTTKPGADSVVVTQFTDAVKSSIRDSSNGELSIVRLLDIWYRVKKSPKPSMKGGVAERYMAFLNDAQTALAELRKAGVYLVPAAASNLTSVFNPVYVVKK